MTMTELNASFSLFPAQEKKSERSPDYGGVIEIPADQIDALVAHLGTQPENNWKDEPVGEELPEREDQRADAAATAGASGQR